jgi:hypothetical protein
VAADEPAAEADEADDDEAEADGDEAETGPVEVHATVRARAVPIRRTWARRMAHIVARQLEQPRRPP